MSGEVVMMTINEGLSFWRVFELTEACPITYEQLYSFFLKEFEIYIQKNRPKLNINIEQIDKKKPLLYIYSDVDVNQKNLITNHTQAVPLNCEILVKINPLCFDNDTNKSALAKYKLPLVSESEAAEAVEKAERVSNLSLRTSLKFYKTASKYSLLKYAEALYKQKKWRKLYPLIDTLREKYSQNAQVSLIIAKCYESFNDNVRSAQAYKEALIFSDSPSLLIECSKLYMNSDKYLSSLLLNRSIDCDSTNPNVIIHSMIELINNKKYDDVFKIAFRSKKSIKFLAKSFKKNDELSKSFIEFFKSIDISNTSLSEEGTSLASLFYKNGAVFESLCLCQIIIEKNSQIEKEAPTTQNKNSEEAKSFQNKSDFSRFDGFFDNLSSIPDISKKSESRNDSIINPYTVDPFIVRVYFTILLNEGLYKRFVDVSKEFISSLFKTNDFDALEVLGLKKFFEDYMGIVACKQRNKSFNQKSSSRMNQTNSSLFPNLQDEVDDNDLTERQEAILDCICAMSSFLFLIGSCNEIGSFSNINSNIIQVESDMPFWQLRLMFSILHPISDTIPTLNLSQPSVMLIGDETALMTSYQVLIILFRPNNPTNIDTQNSNVDDANQNSKDQNDNKNQNLNNKNFANEQEKEKENSILLPNIIIDLSIWKLRKGHKCGQKSSFWSRIETFDESPLLMIELGAVDCDYEIPKLMKKNRFSSINKALEEITNIYIQVVLKIKQKLPNTLIVIHPAIPTNSISSPLVYEFNKKMRIKALGNRIKFLDVFSKYGPLDLAISDKSFVKYLTSLRKWLVINE